MSVVNTHERLLISRYLLPGIGGRLALLIAAIGCAGVAIGVASLVLVVSFMNGAEARLAGQIASVDGHIFATPQRHRLADWRGLERRVEHTAGVATATPSLEGAALITAAGRSFGADLQGLQSAELASSWTFRSNSNLIVGRPPFRSGTIALGSGLASQLGVTVGDHAAVTLPRFDRGSLNVENFDFLITGIVSTDVYAFDSRRVIMPVDDLRTILANGDTFSKISIRLTEPGQQKEVLASLKKRLGSGTVFTTWQDMNAALFAALTQERLAMTIIISLVTLIALSNILSSMVMLVRHKAREIAILRTCGMSRYSIAKVFVGVSAVIGLTGEVAGLGLGFGLKAAKDSIARGLLAVTPHPPIELNVFLSLPLTISGGETAWIIALVSTGVLLSTIYPAIRAAAVDPASVLRYT